MFKREKAAVTCFRLMLRQTYLTAPRTWNRITESTRCCRSHTSWDIRLIRSTFTTQSKSFPAATDGTLTRCSLKSASTLKKVRRNTVRVIGKKESAPIVTLTAPLDTTSNGRGEIQTSRMIERSVGISCALCGRFTIALSATI